MGRENFELDRTRAAVRVVGKEGGHFLEDQVVGGSREISQVYTVQVPANILLAEFYIKTPAGGIEDFVPWDHSDVGDRGIQIKDRLQGLATFILGSGVDPVGDDLRLYRNKSLVLQGENVPSLLTVSEVVLYLIKETVPSFLGIVPLNDSKALKKLELILAGKIRSKFVTSPLFWSLWILYVADMMMPKLAPAPRIAQKRSEFMVLDVSMNLPSAVTRVTETKASIIKP